VSIFANKYEEHRSIVQFYFLLLFCYNNLLELFLYYFLKMFVLPIQKIVRIFLTVLFLSFVLSPVKNAEAAVNTELLTKPWLFSATYGSSERYQLTDQNVLIGTKKLRVTYDLKGTCLLDGDASAIIFDQPINQTWRYASLSKYGKNCFNGMQTVDIPLSDFKGLDVTKPVGTFHARFWHSKPYTIIINSAYLTDSGAVAQVQPPTALPTPTNIPTPTKLPTPTLRIFNTPTLPPSPTIPPFPTLTLIPTLTGSSAPASITPSPTRSSWSIQSVSSMKETKDRICGPRPADFIKKWVDSAANLGVNYISIETPYDNPQCGSSIGYTKAWIDAIRAKGLHVWHRHMPLTFEGIYGAVKNPGADYTKLISDYIKANPGFFAEGDIFTPIPEPQNGGIAGVTYCPQGICIFKDAKYFNVWLRSAMDSSETAFGTIGLGGKMKIGYYGFDGFVAWGDNNPDWDGILEDETVLKMGNITIDHYPEIVGDTMENDLKELEARYPNIPIVIGEWGTIAGTNLEQQVRTSMQAAKRRSVVGFNYWHMGVGGNEELIRDDFSAKSQYDEVQSFFRGI